MRRAKWGIGAVVVVGVAWLLSTLFNIDLGGSGLGLTRHAAVQSDGSRSDPSTSEEPADPEKVDEKGENAPSEQMVSAANPEAAVGADGRIDVRIEDRTYQLRGGSESAATWVPATLETVAAAAKRAQGDDAGIRVRVLRTASSRASAEDALLEALRGSGVKTSEIVIPDYDEQPNPAP